MTLIAETGATPRVTWLIAVKNGLPYIRETLGSLCDQTYTNWEVLVWDNGSTDGTLDELDRWIPSTIPGRVIRDRPMDLGDSRAELVKLSVTELCALIDADDVCMPDRLQTQVDFLVAHPDVAAVGSTCEEIDGRNRNRGVTWPIPADHEGIIHTMLHRNAMMQPAVMFRKSAVLGVGNYRHWKQANIEDYDLWLRLAASKYKLANIMRPLVKYRVHARSTTQLAIADNRLTEAMNDCLEQNAPALYGCSAKDLSLLRERRHPSPLTPIQAIARHLSKTQGGTVNRFKSPTFIEAINKFIPPEDSNTRLRIALLGTDWRRFARSCKYRVARMIGRPIPEPPDPVAVAAAETQAAKDRWIRKLRRECGSSVGANLEITGNGSCQTDIEIGRECIIERDVTIWLYNENDDGSHPVSARPLPLPLPAAGRGTLDAGGSQEVKLAGLLAEGGGEFTGSHPVSFLATPETGGEREQIGDVGHGVEPYLKVGERVFIGRNTYIGVFHPIEIGKNTMIGAYSYIISATHRYASREVPMRDQGFDGAPVEIGEDVWIGTHVTILPGVKIGKGAIIGAGSLVKTDVPSYQVWGGTPARFLKERPG